MHDNYLPEMAEEDCGLCMSPDLQDNSNDFSVVDQLSIVTSSRIGLLSLFIFIRCKHSKQVIYFSQNDILIPHYNLSLMSNKSTFHDSKSSLTVKKSVVLTLLM